VWFHEFDGTLNQPIHRCILGSDFSAMTFAPPALPDAHQVTRTLDGHIFAAEGSAWSAPAPGQFPLKKPSQQPGVFFCDRGIAISEVRAEGFGVTVSCSHDEAFESG
jgi:hypothetical protein